MTKKTIDQKIVAFLPDIDISASSEIRGNLIGAAALISEEIDIAVADAFKTGFEQAVSGGKELTRKVPQLKDAIPLVPYFADAKDRQGFAAIIHAAKPAMREFKVTEAS